MCSDRRNYGWTRKNGLSPLRVWIFWTGSTAREERVTPQSLSTPGTLVDRCVDCGGGAGEGLSASCGGESHLCFIRSYVASYVHYCICSDATWCVHCTPLFSAEGVLRHSPGVLLKAVFVPSCV